MSLYFTKDHEWVRVDGDVATVGISDHAQQALGERVDRLLVAFDQRGEGRLVAIERPADELIVRGGSCTIHHRGWRDRYLDHAAFSIRIIALTPDQLRRAVDDMR